MLVEGWDETGRGVVQGLDTREDFAFFAGYSRVGEAGKAREGKLESNAEPQGTQENTEGITSFRNYAARRGEPHLLYYLGLLSHNARVV